MKRNESTRPRGPDAGVDNHGQLWEDRDAPSHAPPRDLARGPGVVKTPGPHPPAPSAGLALPQVNPDRNLRNIRIQRYPSRIPLFLEITNTHGHATVSREPFQAGSVALAAITPCGRCSGKNSSRSARSVIGLHYVGTGAVTTTGETADDVADRLASRPAHQQRPSFGPQLMPHHVTGSVVSEARDHIT